MYINIFFCIQVRSYEKVPYIETQFHTQHKRRLKMTKQDRQNTWKEITRH